MWAPAALFLLAAAAAGPLAMVADAAGEPGPAFCLLPGLGVLRGNRGGDSYRTANNLPFAAFEGVPYAQPPLGPLRFQPAKSVSPFDYLETRSIRLPCPGLNDKGCLIGKEDCLYLNIYTPKVDADLSLPVLVVLPGEDWVRGYAGRWRPHRILDRGIVLVSVQSRLGALGFLSAEASSAPGNLGLRDESLALSWVQQYIRHFGGDPERVTLAGVGAGAAAAMLHILSPQSAGLFQRVIAVSGSALSPWSLIEEPGVAVNLTRRLGDVLGCNRTVNINATVHSITAAADTLECLRSQSVEDIVKSTAKLQGWLGMPLSPFLPVVDRGVDHPFLPDTPRRLWGAVGAAGAVPLLLGLARSEGLQALASGLLLNGTALADLDSEWTRLAPLLLAFNETDSARSEAAASRLRARYLGGGGGGGGLATPEGQDGLVRLFGDRHVIVPALRAARLHANATKQPVFVYRFSWPAGGGPDPADNQTGLEVSHLLSLVDFTSACHTVYRQDYSEPAG